MPLTIEPAHPAERAEAFRLVFGHLSRADLETRVQRALEMVQQGELDAAGLWVARDSALQGALLCQPMPGAAGLLWPPRLADAERQLIADLLVQHACAWLRSQGAGLAQALLPQTEAHLAKPLERNGFDHVTTLCYLRCWLQRAASAEPRNLTFQPYAADPAAFEATLPRTYDATLDCPELTGARTLDEIMASHRAQGPPELWWLALEGGSAVGVLFLVRESEWQSVDLAYVGLVPSARNRGLGRQLLWKAFAEARRLGVEQMTVSVDIRNQPALHLYHSAGFEPFDQREVYLAVWRRGAVI